MKPGARGLYGLSAVALLLFLSLSASAFFGNPFFNESKSSNASSVNFSFLSCGAMNGTTCSESQSCLNGSWLNSSDSGYCCATGCEDLPVSPAPSMEPTPSPVMTPTPVPTPFPTFLPSLEGDAGGNESEGRVLVDVVVCDDDFQGSGFGRCSGGGGFPTPTPTPTPSPTTFEILLIAPPDHSVSTSRQMAFAYLPVASRGISNASVYTNHSGWTAAAVNSSPVANASLNSFNLTLDSSGSFVWAVKGCLASGSCNFSGNFTHEVEVLSAIVSSPSGAYAYGVPVYLVFVASGDFASYSANYSLDGEVFEAGTGAGFAVNNTPKVVSFGVLASGGHSVGVSVSRGPFWYTAPLAFFRRVGPRTQPTSVR